MLALEWQISGAHVAAHRFEGISPVTIFTTGRDPRTRSHSHSFQTTAAENHDAEGFSEPTS